VAVPGFIPSLFPVLRECFDSLIKIAQVLGKVLISPPDPIVDKLARVGEGNLTYDLWNQRMRNRHPEDQFVHLPNSGHWNWNKATQQTVDNFLGVEAPVDGLPEDAKPPSYFNPCLLPNL